MNRQLEAVREFQAAIGHPNRSNPSVDVPEAELRAVLVEEEAAEFAAAVRAGDLVETADAIADLLVVVYGAALCFGIPIDAVFEEVHRTNMLKADGPVREDGKRMKPPGWTPPDVAGVLASCTPVIGCGCSCHTFPGVYHVAPCCDEPPVDFGERGPIPGGLIDYVPPHGHPAGDDVSPDITDDVKYVTDILLTRNTDNPEGAKFAAGRILSGLLARRGWSRRSAPGASPDALVKALDELAVALITVKPSLDKPYPDDPRWTPWTRWCEKPFEVAGRVVDEYQKSVRPDAP